MSFRSGNLLLVAFFSMMLAYFPAEAGNLELLWDPSPDAVSYRLYTSTTPGQFGTSPVWEGTATETSVDGLQNCTMHYFVATAVNAVGESGHSNETSGWPRPEIVGVAPSSVEQGRRLDLIISGTNFQIGSQLSFSDPGIVVHGFSISSCNEIVADVEVTNAAGAGPVDVVVAHPNDVKGTGVGVLSVEAAVAPAVISTSPADGATDVSITVQPTVQFSEPMLGTSITVSSVVLLDDAGSPIAQAAGSPTLSGDGTSATIVPGADLGEGRTYRIRVVGGATGVLDLAGHPMDTTFTQATGFRTAGATAPPVISGVDTSEVLDTSARIVWTTDRPADSQVSYRIVGEATYQQTPVDPTLVTDHEVVLDGLQPGTDYEYHVRSADESGSSSESSPDETFTTVASSYAYLRFEAESGTVAFPVVREAASDVFSGGKVRLPVGSPVGTPAVPSGSVRFGFYAPVSGTYYLWVRVYGSNTGTGSW